MENTQNDIYKAPTSELDVNSDLNGIENFERFSAWWVFLLSAVTLGLYQIYWLYTRSTTMNSLHDKKIPKWTLMGVVVSMTVLMAADVASEFIQADQILNIVSIVSNVFYIGLYVYVLFALKNRLEGIINSPLNGIFTLFGSVIYLQYKINERLDSAIS
ncbi:Uncharacterised protein [BD1-7 clade bacterium]|uniref:DUF4234 domain-containing protein n=1 Tax=BD1-7 clade bacterium TaxID=2029982 RepID=A0A5S9PVU3_9GAMM|nr:Uncharacterised protein [BD1-7 clade bacterium]CAA0113049.1 Uncharacterised protein [BD1-7 clade bacterium]